MELIHLGPLDLAITAGLLLLMAGLSWQLRLGVGRRILISATRSIVQLLLVGLVLRFIFEAGNPWMIAGITLVMLTAAGYEVMARQKHRYLGGWGFGIGATSMFVSSFSMTLMALLAVISVKPWYTPQYLIPLLGMLLGNTMNGVSVALDNLTQNARRQRREIEGRLILGQPWFQAIADIRRDALRMGLIPIINAMAAAGLVSLPGMMTGQILSGSPPLEAAKYQIMIMLLIATGTGLGAIIAVWLGSRRLFDERHRLRLERLKAK